MRDALWLLWDNHNHRPCRWFAQAPLGPITSRAYRLIESSFYCMMRPTAIEIAAWRILLFTSLDYLPFLIAPYQLLSRLVPRFARIFFLGIAKAFWNHRHCRWFSLYNKKGSLQKQRAFCSLSNRKKGINRTSFCSCEQLQTSAYASGWG